MSKRPAILQDRQIELALAMALFMTSAWLTHDAFERRGKPRPFTAKFLPLP